MTSLVLEIPILSKTAKFPFRTMDYTSKNLINRNRLKKFMQVDIDVTCMYTDFGGCDLSGFGDTNTLKNSQFPFRTMDYSPWSSKNLIAQNQFKKFLQVEVDLKCMQTNFGGHGLSSFGDFAPFHFFKISLLVYGLKSVG